MRRLLLLVTTCLAASHPELRGELPDPADIDNGQCVPIKCEAGIPPRECTRLCALRHYLPVCQPPGDFCLCQRLSGGSIELVSPDEVLDQPPNEELTGLNIFAFILPMSSFFREDSRKVAPPSRMSLEHLSILDPVKSVPSESNDHEDDDSFPSLFAEHSWNVSNVSEAVVVNVHEGRLYWLFRYVLTGLFLLIVALILFEVLMCQMYNYEKLDFELETQEKKKPIKTKKFIRTLDIV